MAKYLFLIIWFLGCSSTVVKKPLSIGFWNIENLFDLIDDPNKRDDEFSLNGRKNVTKEVYDLKINNSAKVLFDLNVDVLGLCEVENINVLEDLNEAYKERNYKIIHYDSPDERGIDNALMYDENQFSIIESRPIKNIIKKGDRTRDILYVKGLYDRELLHLFINHWPSNYGGKERAIPKRMSTANLLINEISMIKEEDQDAEIILLGDFNENPDDKNIELLSSVGLYSLMKPMIKIPKKGTYVYRGEDYFYDQIIVNDNLLDKKALYIVASSTFILDFPKYRQQEGKYKHYPFRFWAGDKLLGGYSDHLAIRAEINKIK